MKLVYIEGFRLHVCLWVIEKTISEVNPKVPLLLKSNRTKLIQCCLFNIFSSEQVVTVPLQLRGRHEVRKSAKVLYTIQRGNPRHDNYSEEEPRWTLWLYGNRVHLFITASHTKKSFNHRNSCVCNSIHLPVFNRIFSCVWKVGKLLNRSLIIYLSWVSLLIKTFKTWFDVVTTENILSTYKVLMLMELRSRGLRIKV